ncbi:hypothetical protein AHF37_06735 [Paragonimus kellicotti]|nr:hypothetical protein AHF37_06735 [Paragonimus kellicotti]
MRTTAIHDQHGTCQQCTNHSHTHDNIRSGEIILDVGETISTTLPKVSTQVSQTYQTLPSSSLVATRPASESVITAHTMQTNSVAVSSTTEPCAQPQSTTNTGHVSSAQTTPTLTTTSDREIILDVGETISTTLPKVSTQVSQTYQTLPSSSLVATRPASESVITAHTMQTNSVAVSSTTEPCAQPQSTTNTGHVSSAQTTPTLTTTSDREIILDVGETISTTLPKVSTQVSQTYQTLPSSSLVATRPASESVITAHTMQTNSVAVSSTTEPCAQPQSTTNTGHVSSAQTTPTLTTTSDREIILDVGETISTTLPKDSTQLQHDQPVNLSSLHILCKQNSVAVSSTTEPCAQPQSTTNTGHVSSAQTTPTLTTTSDREIILDVGETISTTLPKDSTQVSQTYQTLPSSSLVATRPASESVITAHTMQTNSVAVSSTTEPCAQPQSTTNTGHVSSAQTTPTLTTTSDREIILDVGETISTTLPKDSTQVSQTYQTLPSSSLVATRPASESVITAHTVHTQLASSPYVSASSLHTDWPSSGTHMQTSSLHSSQLPVQSVVVIKANSTELHSSAAELSGSNHVVNSVQTTVNSLQNTFSTGHLTEIINNQSKYEPAPVAMYENVEQQSAEIFKSSDSQNAFVTDSIKLEKETANFVNKQSIVSNSSAVAEAAVIAEIQVVEIEKQTTGSLNSVATSKKVTDLPCSSPLLSVTSTKTGPTRQPEIRTTERIIPDLSKLRPNVTHLTTNGLPKQNIETVRNKTVCQDNATAACAGISSAGVRCQCIRSKRFGDHHHHRRYVACDLVLDFHLDYMRLLSKNLVIIKPYGLSTISCASSKCRPLGKILAVPKSIVRHYKRHRKVSWQNRRLAGTHPLHTPSTLMPVELCTKGNMATYNLPRVYVTPGNRPETSQPSDRKYMTHNEQRALNQLNYLNTPINISGNMSEGRCGFDVQANQKEANTVSSFGYGTPKVLTMYPSVKHEPIPGTRVRDSGMQNAYAMARVNSCDCPEGFISTNQGTMQVVADEFHVDLCEPDMGASPGNVSTFLKQIYIEPDCKGKQTRAIRRG